MDAWRKQLEAVKEVPHAGAKQAGIAGAPSSGIIHTVRSGKRPALWHGLIKPTPLIIALARMLNDFIRQ